MSAPSFDPCKQWLGIDAVDLGDPRRVLGVPPDVVDAQAIIRAATIKLSLLQSVAPGPFAMAHAALVRRVTEARDALLAEAAAAAPPRFSMPPPPSAIPPAVPSIPMVPRGPAPPPVPPAAAEPVIAFTTREVPNYRPKSSVGPLMLVAVAGLSAAAGVMAYQALQPRTVADVGNHRGAEDGQKPSIPVPPKKTADDDPRRPLPEDRGVSTSPPPAYQEREHERRREEMSQPDEAEPPASTDAPERARGKPMAAQSDASNTAPQTEPKPEPENEPEPGPADEPAANPSADTDRADAKVQGLLKEAFAAMQKQEYDGARLAMAAARKAASTAAAKDRITSFEELNDCAEKFYDYRAKALAAVRPGVEYDIPTATDTRKIAVIELNDEEFVFKEAGGTKRFPRDKIPSAVLTHIVREWFDERSENYLFLGAYFATRPEPDLDNAADEWATAQAGGVDASSLTRLLEDPILQAAAE